MRVTETGVLGTPPPAPVLPHEVHHLPHGSLTAACFRPRPRRPACHLELSISLQHHQRLLCQRHHRVAHRHADCHDPQFGHLFQRPDRRGLHGRGRREPAGETARRWKSSCTPTVPSCTRCEGESRAPSVHWHAPLLKESGLGQSLGAVFAQGLACNFFDSGELSGYGGCFSGGAMVEGLP